MGLYAFSWQLGFGRPWKYLVSSSVMPGCGTNLIITVALLFRVGAPPPSGSSSDWWLGWRRWGRPYRWGRAIQNPIPLSKYYGLELIVQVGQVQLHPAKRAHSPPYLYINRGGEGDELNRPEMERKIHTRAHKLCTCVGVFFLFCMDNWVDMMSCWDIFSAVTVKLHTSLLERWIFEADTDINIWELTNPITIYW